MDFIDLLLQIGLVTSVLVAYLLIFRRSAPLKFTGKYRQPAWNYSLRLLLAKYAVRRWKSERPLTSHLETPCIGQREGWDCFTLKASAPDGSAVFLRIRKLYAKPALTEITVHIKLADGTCYQLPQHPDTVVGPWEDVESCWSAGGLKIELVEEQTRLRILYNGLLKREDGVVQHVRCNFIWTSVSDMVRHPEDWSNELAAQALALEPWRDGDWPSTLGKWKDGSWLQWGTIQGRVECFDEQGAIDKSAYLRVRGVKERAWSLTGYQGLRRSIDLVATAKDGTAVHLRGFSYKDVLTLGFTGCVRFPDYTVESITDTDLVLAEFCEEPETVPSAFTINVSTSKRDLKLFLRINSDNCKLLSGVPYQHEAYYRTMHVDINGEKGTGVLELGYQTTGEGPTVRLPAISLRWASELEVGSVDYCVPFAARAAACPGYVGGKGASLALLASVQAEMNYKVPPGYCLTTKALEKQLEANPDLKSAILDIEAASENYDEQNFRAKCNKVTELFAKTEIVSEVQEQILSQLSELRKKAAEQNLGPELRFAVRSSAVGEDSEALSAAGQNETILGCSTDGDVLRGVRLCWGSMFAFTSAHYRRQNGQPCLCGGAVVIQAMVRPLAAGVLFTRHPATADPRSLLLTANYGLGESVVSGSVEPDTIIITRGKELAITKIELGSKKQRITAVGSGVTTEDVCEEEQKLPCLTEAQALELARIGVAQEEAWGAGRDIEWAVTEESIYLLQARPITSLERWTEEALLHEMDTAVMADDELLTFANTGEVMPKPASALSYDLVYFLLQSSIRKLLKSKNKYDNSITHTHHRATLNLYNSIYRIMPKKIDLTIRMMETSIYGHRLLDDQMLSIAHHRRAPRAIDKVYQMWDTLKFLIRTKSCMNDAIKTVKGVNINTNTSDPMKMLESIESVAAAMQRCCMSHLVTSAGSTSSQFVAMMVLVEGAEDFTNDQCSEMNVLLSSGGVLSAEVPQALATITRIIEDSGKADEFRAQEPKNAMEWLKQNVTNAYQEVTTLLEEHGHRAIMEFDLCTKPWALVPDEMMAVLQNMRATKEQTQASLTDAEIVASLKTPKKASTRRVLRWVLPLCRRTVRHREATKAQVILAIHKTRLALLRLADLLVKRWYLPERDVIFHFRLHELRSYLLKRDPALLKKAMQRRQYFPSWCKLKFAETHTGWVEPLQSVGPRVVSGDVRLQATAVCAGDVLARACVVKELAEIGQLQRGDVLITHSTDIGWSPYFPLISGIVTELGGLISHGAVIAREYGLPCLVGAANATDMFITGDTVRLSATTGFIEKVSLQNTEASDATENGDVPQHENVAAKHEGQNGDVVQRENKVSQRDNHNGDVIQHENKVSQREGQNGDLPHHENVAT